jgi:hypothetical protein
MKFSRVVAKWEGWRYSPGLAWVKTTGGGTTAEVLAAAGTGTWPLLLGEAAVGAA